MGTKIEWTEETWNPVRGCSRVSEGCRNCYAERMAARFSRPAVERRKPFAGCSIGPDGMFRRQADAFHDFARDGKWTGRVELIPSKLDEPLHWRKPRMVFVNSMSDLFHESLPDEAIDQVFAVMALAQGGWIRFHGEKQDREREPQPCHTMQVLTKRPARAKAYLSCPKRSQAINDAFGDLSWRFEDEVYEMVLERWPLPNVWLGVSVEDQKTADERIPLLLQTPAALRFVSYEPALGPVELRAWLGPVHPDAILDWVIVGGESGPGARLCNVEWIYSVVRQCREAGVLVFVKQLGSNCGFASDRPDREWFQGRSSRSAEEAGYQGVRRLKHPKGGDPAEWPEDLRVREMPVRGDHEPSMVGVSRDGQAQA